MLSSKNPSVSSERDQVNRVWLRGMSFATNASCLWKYMKEGELPEIKTLENMVCSIQKS